MKIQKISLNNCKKKVELIGEYNTTMDAMKRSRYKSPILQEWLNNRDKRNHGDIQPKLRYLVEQAFDGEVIFEDSSSFKPNRMDLRQGLRPDFMMRYRNGRQAIWELCNHNPFKISIARHYLKKLTNKKIQKLHVCAMAWSQNAFDLVKKRGGRFFTFNRDSYGELVLIEVM